MLTDNEARLRQAQLQAVNYLHAYLPMYPVCWICRKLDRQFLYVYLKNRTKFVTLKVALAMFFFSTCFPYLYENVAVGNTCVETGWNLKSPIPSYGDHMTMKPDKSTCAAEASFRSTNIMIWGFGITLVTCLVLLMISRFRHQFRNIEFQLLTFMKPYLPRVFFNGMGPLGSSHSLWSMLHEPERDLSRHFNILHDLLGSVDIVLCCLGLVASLVLTLTVMGWRSQGLAGSTLGASVALVMGRLELLVMNHWLGASDTLMGIVESELRTARPYMKVLGGLDLHIRTDKLRRKTDEVADYYMNLARERNHVELQHLSEQIRSDGFDVLHYIATWLKQHERDLLTTFGCAWELFQAGASFTCTEYTLASLSLLDPSTLLGLYFMPDWNKLSGLCGWQIQGDLARVYIPNPNNIYCERNSDNDWECKGDRQMEAEFREVTEEYLAMP